MATYQDQSFRREREIKKDCIMKLRSKALVLLREAMFAANQSSKELKVGDPKKVWKATYEAVIASAPTDVREIANFMRNYYGFVH
uniref:Uncharacterized protein n=1 Tax=viral metagenome TaxID=1070528 RepID=A0A6C0CGK0_9ZZZZ